jgi:hypothetical protein
MGSSAIITNINKFAALIIHQCVCVAMNVRVTTELFKKSQVSPAIDVLLHIQSQFNGRFHTRHIQCDKCHSTVQSTILTLSKKF